MTSDFIYKQVISGCLKVGVSQTQSRNAAVVASEKCKKGQYTGKVSAFIVKSITDAKKVKG